MFNSKRNQPWYVTFDQNLIKRIITAPNEENSVSQTRPVT